MKTPPINTKFINSLPVLLSSSIACIIVYAYHWSTYFSPLFLGIIAGGLVDLDNGLTGKLKNLCFTIVAFTISSLSVQLTFQHPIAHARPEGAAVYEQPADSVRHAVV